MSVSELPVFDISDDHNLVLNLIVFLNKEMNKPICLIKVMITLGLYIVDT
jgi:hypothetical protein